MTILDPAHRLTRALAGVATFALVLAGCGGHAGGGKGTGGGGGGAPLPASCAAPSPGARLLRRLARSEYDATIQDLFGFVSTWGASMTADTVVNGFDNNAGALRVSPLLADQVRRAAEEIAAKAMASPKGLVPCDPANGDDACAGGLIDALGKRAFRRPLTGADHARYLALHQSVAKASGFAAGAEAVIAAMLQSPHFLYRTELGDGAGEGATVKLTPFEIASELSYLFWGTMPDAELFAAADSGALAKPDEIDHQARRLLADPRADATITRFVEQWLEIDHLATIPKDAATYPELDAAARAALREETRRFVLHIVREGKGTLGELLTARSSPMTPALAKFYGLPAPSGPADADGFADVDLSSTARAGLLTQGSVLATHGKPNSSSPIHRGKLVRERLFCQPLPPPPAGLVIQPPPLDPSQTTRQRYAAHASVEPCKSCHRLMDPIGFGFERFDGIGRERDTEAGQPVDASGEIFGAAKADGPFDGAVDLASRLAESRTVHDCFAMEWVRFAYGATEDQDLACLASQVGDDFEKDGLGVQDLIVALTRAARFTERVRDGSEGGAGGGSTSQSASGSGGSGSGGGGGAGGGSTGAGGTTMSDLGVETAIDSQWAGGYQESVKVTNNGSSPIAWTVTLDVDGKIANLWNAASMPSGAKIAFSGVDYDATLGPGASASFGFVATK
jgi:Protein of unknown function (DUF1592)/Protein of unknown function (DUF1588)/Protein of unknown function (DUF1595)/Protein of unknown function (DUF1587)/Cellulose binding domain/Protein of unknown function (DUF1585)